MKSIVNVTQMENAARQQRDEAYAKAEADKAKAAAEKAKAEGGAPDAASPEVKTAPEDVRLSFVKSKEMTATEFLADYADLVQQVETKQFLPVGYATIERQIYDQTVRFKTLRKAEDRVINGLSENGVNAITGNITFDSEERMRWLALFMVTGFGKEVYEPIKLPRVFGGAQFKSKSSEDLAKLVNDVQVQKRLEMFENLPAPIFNQIAMQCFDLSTAFSLALQKDMSHP